MVNSFPKIYDDELLYSIIARYHVLSGNVSYKKTLKQIFNVDSIIATMEFNGHIENLVKILPENFNINSEYLIENHTLFPIYAPFLPVKRKSTILEKMKNYSGKNIKTQIGYISGSVLKKNGIAYCPLCASYELKNYGETYIHRLHQVEGVIVCPIHRCLLEIYNINLGEVSRLKFITFNPNLLTSRVTYPNNSYLDKLIRISDSFKFLLENRVEFLNQDLIHKMYLKLLDKRNLVVGEKRVRQRELHEQFLCYYGKDFLELLNSYPEPDNEYNWIKVLIRKPNRVVHPLRQILLILFLCGSIEEFSNNTDIHSSNIHNNKKFPCLNPICDHYKKNIVRKYEMKIDNKTKNKIGTFYCDCGFTYSRNINSDIYSIGKVINYGPKWESILKRLIEENKHSLRGIARLMGCDPKTVVKYADKLNLKHMLNSSMDISYIKVISKVFIDSQKYKEDIIIAITENPDWNRTQIRKALNKQYIWLYKNDRSWLEENLPAPKTSKKVQYKNIRVNWNERDTVLLDMLQAEYRRLLLLSEVPRITNSFIGRMVNKLALIEKHLDKLPLSRKFMDEIYENVRDFQKRRVINILGQIQQNDEEIVLWKVIRKAGLRGNLTLMVESIINEWKDKDRKI